MNSENPKISVIMPVYNVRHEYLHEAIDSILSQTYTDFELIICDDCSPNGAPDEVIASYNDPRIRYVKNEKNLGISGNTNKMIQLARGEYIAQMDNDDIALPQRLEKTCAYLDAHPEVDYVGGWQEYFPKYKLWAPPLKFGYLELLHGCPICHSTLLYRKSTVEKYNLYYDPEYKTAMDYELWTRVLKVAKMVNLPEVFLRYRWNGENTSITAGERQRFEYVKIRKQILNFLAADPKLAKKIAAIADTKKLSFFEHILYVRNDGDRKKINIFGIKFHIKRKKRNKKSN